MISISQGPEWLQLQESKNTKAILCRFNLFYITYFAALKSHFSLGGEEGIRKEHQFSRSWEKMVFISQVERSLIRVWTCLISTSSFYVCTTPLSNRVLLVKEPVWQASDYDFGCLKEIYDSYLYPVFPKMAKLLGARVIEEREIHEIPNGFFGAVSETVMKVTFLWESNQC